MVNRVVGKSDCSGCGACECICPKNCITMREDEEGFLYPFVDESSCIKCNVCIDTCPSKNTENCGVGQKYSSAYAVKNKNSEIRKSSSSGGFFSKAAEQVINSGGIVFGAAMDENLLKVTQISVSDREKLQSIRNSKYIQSETKKSFKEVKQLLEASILVLYSGTPCQIAGLKAFLKKEYDNLITCDFICHGVPSPLVWVKYLKKLETIYGSKANKVNFKDKSTGWSSYSISVQFDNGYKYKKKHYEDLFFKGFLSNIFLRPSCYNCKQKGDNRKSDITMGDFWGVNNILENFSDDSGVSAIIINTEKGKNFFDRIKEDLIISKSDFYDIVKSNPSLIHSVKEPKNRKKFFLRLKEKNDVNECIKKSLKPGLVVKAKSLLKRIISKIR